MENPLVKDVAGLSRPLTKLVAVVAAGCGRIYEPTHIRNVAIATADAERTRAQTAIEVEELNRRANEREQNRRSRRQHNVEEIAAKAQKYLPPSVSAEPVDEDWAFEFFEECQDTGNDRLQELWAKLLAAEVASPGACSKRTLKIVRSMAKAEAEAFTRLCACVLESGTALFVVPTQFYYVPEIGLDVTILHELEALGVLTVSQRVNMALEPTGGHINYFGRQFWLTSPTKASIPYMALTARGAELRRVVDAKPDERYLKAMINRLVTEHNVWIASVVK